MVWVADVEARRTYDPVSGSELKTVWSEPTGWTRFKLVSPGHEALFDGSVSERKLLQEEKHRLGVTSAIVWTLLVGGDLPNDLRDEIAKAILAFKFTHGFVGRDEKYFVSFGLKGKLIGE